MNRPPSLHDIVIAGAGPVGSVPACELRTAGILGVALEMRRRVRPSSGCRSACAGFRCRRLRRAFDRRGLLEEERDAPWAARSALGSSGALHLRGILRASSSSMTTRRHEMASIACRSLAGHQPGGGDAALEAVSLPSARRWDGRRDPERRGRRGFRSRPARKCAVR